MTSRSSATSASSSSSRRLASGARSATTIPTVASASTASPGSREYSAVADNNVCTNPGAAEPACRGGRRRAPPRHAAAFGADLEEAAAWRDAAREMVIPWDESLGVHPQSEASPATRCGTSSARHRSSTAAAALPVLRPLPQAGGQAGRSGARAPRLRRRVQRRGRREDFAYYEARTSETRRSRPVQAVVAAEVGHLELAYDYFGEAALMDLHDLQGNTEDGLHVASLAGACIAVVAGFGGARDHGGALSFAPQLPARLERLAFRLRVAGRRLESRPRRRMPRTRSSRGCRSRSVIRARSSHSRSARRSGRKSLPASGVRRRPSHGRAPLRRGTTVSRSRSRHDVATAGRDAAVRRDDGEGRAVRGSVVVRAGLPGVAVAAPLGWATIAVVGEATAEARADLEPRGSSPSTRSGGQRTTCRSDRSTCSTIRFCASPCAPST